MSPPEDDRARVLVLIKGLGLGGAENLIAESAPLWDMTSFRYRVVYLLPWKDQLVESLHGAGIPVSCVDWRGPSSIGGLRRLRKEMMTWEPDIVHSHLPVAGILARGLATRSRNVYTEHNVVDFYRQPTRSLNRATYGRNDAVIAVSNSVATSISGYPGPEPIVIPNGVSVHQPEPTTLAKVRRELEIDGSTPLVVHVGNIRPHKGHENLIDAVKLLVDDRPEVVTVSIGGEKNAGDLARVRQKADSLGLSDRMRFLGRREDAHSFLAAADVVVNPSDVEGLPLVILEALAFARPVVATDVGGVSSVVRDRETGILVKPGDPAELAEAIALALDSAEAPNWGRAGSKLIADQHGLAAMVAGYESVYRGLLT